MSHPFLESCVSELRFTANDAAGRRNLREQTLSASSVREWRRHIGVLDRAGLTLPLYARLLERGEGGKLPPEAIAALERRCYDNARRMQEMLETFDEAVQALRRVEVQFVCVKGFSLIPEFLPELWQRHQIDFDVLIEGKDEARAQAALEELGYKLTAVDGGERRMRVPVTRALGHDAYVYDRQEGPAIELHSAFWENGTMDFPLRFPKDSLDHAEMHALGSVSFPRLEAPCAFLYQVLHMFRHFRGSWARPLWIYEIAAYLNRFVDDEVRWERVRALIANDERMADAVGLVLMTAREIFGCPIPVPLRDICAVAGDSAIGLWVSRCAREWLLTDMPGNKLNLLLHRHFIGEEGRWRRHLADRLMPRRKRPRLCEGIDPAVEKSFRYRMANFRFQGGRLAHHFRTGVEFALAGARWKLELRARRMALGCDGPRVSEAEPMRRGAS